MSHHTEGTLTAFDGLTIFHQAWLPDGDPGAVVMLIHGLGEHSGRYAHVAEALTDAGYAVHALDHRGHGQVRGQASVREVVRRVHAGSRSVPTPTSRPSIPGSR